MAWEKDILHSGTPIHVLSRNQNPPVTNETWLVQGIRMLVASKSFLVARVRHWLLAFQTSWRHEVTKRNIAAVRSTCIVANKDSATLA